MQAELPTPRQSLVFFFIRLVERLRALGTAPAADLMEYARSLESLSGYPGRSGEKVPDGNNP